MAGNSLQAEKNQCLNTSGGIKTIFIANGIFYHYDSGVTTGDYHAGIR
ncbi:MAG: hypothetical protein IKK76_02505 [Alphaproteobacteria bacterium]|nr:hypothetical protein [Alphaproteobacteria bacterium]